MESCQFVLNLLGQPLLARLRYRFVGDFVAEHPNRIGFLGNRFVSLASALGLTFGCFLGKLLLPSLFITESHGEPREGSNIGSIGVVGLKRVYQTLLNTARLTD